ncbi:MULTISPECIES: TonB-dependent receptor [Stenotrophomonas]|uniref:TonB dependent receptor protein n=2 Tax=Stenotrophomonas acidaminiphila TaxID=128780 RepID=A0A0S1AUW7_9GAMM|nr:MULTISPECIES: TonB-dependent receptor [Stenotrophomonas]OZB52631.1 MAG: TonB-dependent receptor [Stenotrophomonas sp. 14-69-23]ALJ26556.1 TonB dependent receptor protein [Stenotrophomonas acidaminiphila]MCA7025027.1 TonB-dependent receptor [Stenotrophomonas acidaminiphila]MCE4075683.1 TonB-dependent receptor [Stenotrophomonas acidaminiphila]WHL19112.1 TonB-dependent receptor [Stenotrophomonas acidaminiphila]
MSATARPPRMHHLSAALLLALGSPLAAFAQSQPTAAAASPEARTLDKIEVTGSRIKRTDVEAAMPVTIIQKAEIEAQGITSAEQLLQQLNIASSGPDSLAANSGVAPPGTRGNNGVSGANLRGQGADATLVLLNGRRVAAHGLAGQVVDLNSIPFAAIERVEVLRDGASAVYGTDAIGGVINFITRNNYQGITLTAGADVTQEGGGNIFHGSLLGGWGDLDNDRWNVWAAVNVKQNKILRGNQRDFVNSFQADRGLSPDTRGTPFANIVTGTGSMIGGGLKDPVTGLTKTTINTLRLPGGAGCENGGDMMGDYGDKIWASPGASFGCAWDYGRARTIQQPVDTVQGIGRATFKVGENHEFFAEFMGSKVTSKRQFEAQQITTSINASATQLDAYELNANTKATYDAIYNQLHDYFGNQANLVYGSPIAYRWRCEVCGPRQIETTTKAYRALLGMTGSLGSWDYNIGLSRAQSKAESMTAGGYYYTPQLKAALKNGVLNPFLMPGQSQSQAAYDALAAADASGLQIYEGTSTTTTFDASFSGSLGFRLWSDNDVQAAAGVDVRREEYEFGGPAEWVAGNAYVFGVPGDASNYMSPKQRNVKAVFAEVNLPVVDSLEVNLAVRHDRYDGFGGTTNPKYSFKWQPMDWLVFRGSYSTGFKVPDFAKLFRGVTETQYTGLDLADPATCPKGQYNPDVANCSEQIRPDIITGGNPNLKPEEAEQRSIGFVIAPNGNFNVSVDWWEIERTNTIRSGFNLSTMTANYPLYASNFIRDSGGKIIAIDQRYINTGGTLTRGIELDSNVRGDLAGGTWNIHLNGNYLDTFRTKTFDSLPYSDNLVGEYERYYNLPIRWKHTVSAGWARGDWAHTLTQVYRGGYKDWKPGGVVNGYNPPAWDGNVDAYITYNYSLTWTGMENLKATFGIRNLLNTDPPFTVRYLDDGDGAGWEARVADPRGRSFNLLLEYRFQ